MALQLDFGLLESDRRFQAMCFRLAVREFRGAVPCAHGSWDGGRDVVCFGHTSGDTVWQCKFTQRSLSELKPKILESLRALDPSRPMAKWILCVSADGSGVFLDWLRATIESGFPFIAAWELWDKQQLLIKLEVSRDILQIFFLPAFKNLEAFFRTDELEIVRYALDPSCGWKQPDPSVISFVQVGGASSDLVIDVIVRSRGTIQSLIEAIQLNVYDVKPRLRGLPGSGLLYPQNIYSISLHGGKPGSTREFLEPPLIVNGGEHQRFKIKLTDSGYSWLGYIQMALLYAKDRELWLPATFLTP
jgi:hypothetical protein